MSVTVTAAPFLLLSAVSFIVGEIQNISTKNDIKKMHLEKNDIKKMFEEEIETAIVDKDTLIKTLTEHGAKITYQGEYSVSCSVDNFVFNFYKKTQTKETPYTLKVKYDDNFNLEETIKDIGEEYAENAQEISYNIIKERLEEQNLTISNEEIYEDNTIVLTVNLE